LITFFFIFRLRLNGLLLMLLIVDWIIGFQWLQKLTSIRSLFASFFFS